MLFEKHTIRPTTIFFFLLVVIGVANAFPTYAAVKCDPSTWINIENSPAQDSMEYPWTKIDLTGTHMKPFLDMPASIHKPFPVIPGLVGLAGTGALIYAISKNDKDEDPVDCNFTVFVTPGHPQCGLSNGFITVRPSPPGDYTYTWSHGPTAESLVDLPAGMYQVTITQAGTMCQQVRSIDLINNNTTINASATTQPANCGAMNGAAQITVNPAGNYQYQWSNGLSGAQQSNLAGGNYQVTVSTGVSCQQVISFTIEEDELNAVISFTSTPASCGASNGIIEAIVEPADNYTLTWSNGATGNVISTIEAGTYTVTVTLPGSSCEISATHELQSGPADFIITPTVTPATCGNDDGAASVVVEPVDTYEYSWSGGQTGNSVSGLAPGVYEVTVTKSGTACSLVQQVTIDEQPASFVITSTVTPSTCGLPDGTATIAVDPPDTYDHAWSTGQTGSQATMLPAGMYSVTVTKTGTTCSLVHQLTIEELPVSFVITSNITPATCGLADGTATVVVDPAGAYDYIWPDGQTGAQATSLAEGTYTVTVTQTGTNCSRTHEVIISVVPPSFTYLITTTPTACDSMTGTASIAIDPPGEYDIQWPGGQMGTQATGLGAGTYQVSIAQAGSACFVTDSFVIESHNATFTGTFVVDTASCGTADGNASIVIDPPGTYTYAWSNGQSGSALNLIPSGSYDVSVTDENQCQSVFSVFIPELPAEYITLQSTTPATCTGGGNIIIELSTSGTGPLDVQITGAQSIALTLAPGVHSLAEHFNVLSGTYTISVIDTSVSTTCIEIIDVMVDSQATVITALDDVYTTSAGVNVFGNVLANDVGLMLMVEDIVNVIGGSVSFLGDGTFSFVPAAGFTDTASFTYNVTDACGTVASANVVIIIEETTCNFTIQFTMIPSNCGISNGYLSIEVNEPGNYSYLWDTGQSGSQLENIAADNYTVTITNTDLDCELVFSFEVTEYPAEYIDAVTVTQPACGEPGDIALQVSTPGAVDMLTMLINHPNGSDFFEIEAGPVLVSDYVSITPGMYTIEFTIGTPVGDCEDAVEVFLNAPPQLTIVEEAVIPPSGPSGMDGAAIIVLTSPAQPPYTVLVNGVFHSIANNNTIVIGGLGVGTYTVQVVDALGCESNELTIVVPPPGIIISLASVIASIPYDVSAPEMEHSLRVAQGISVQMEYTLGGVHQQLRMTHFPGDKRLLHQWDVVHLSQLWTMEKRRVGFDFLAGMGSRFDQPLYGTLSGQGRVVLPKVGEISGALSALGGNGRVDVMWELRVRVDFKSVSQIFPKIQP
jgi:hypothetical protein